MKNRPGQGGDHGELWLISYADMMTLLFGFFVILYSISKIDESKLSSVAKEVAEAFGAKVQKADSPKADKENITFEQRELRAYRMLVSMMNLGSNSEQAVNRIEKAVSESQSFQAAKEIINSKIKTKDDSVLSLLSVSTHQDEDQIEIIFPDTTVFRSGTAELTNNAIQGIHRIAQQLKAIGGLSSIEVVGHTDSAPLPAGSLYPNNWALSSARAGAVAQELIDGGVPRTEVVTRGMADLQPLFPEKSPDGKPLSANMTKNRRVNIILRKIHHGDTKEN